MAGCCSKSCLSFLILISNLLFCLIGILTIAGAVWVVSDEDSTEDIAYKITDNLQLNENDQSEVKESFREVFDNDTIWQCTIGFGVASILTALVGFLRFKIGSNRLFYLVMYNLIFSIVLFTMHIAVVAKLHQRNVDIVDLKNHNELWEVNPEELEGSSSDQTVFFGVLIAMTCSLGILEFIILIEVIENMPK